MLQDAAARAKESIPATYSLSQDTGKPEIDPYEAEVLLWTQLGKLYTLFGRRAFDRFQAEEGKKRARDEDLMNAALEEAAENYTLGLEYDRLLSDSYRDILRAKDEIYERAKTLNPFELEIFAKKVMQVEDDYHLGKSVIRDLLRNRTLWFGD